jgi:hypothetical protein
MRRWLAALSAASSEAGMAAARERERERQAEVEAEAERERETEGQGEGQGEREREREGERERDMYVDNGLSVVTGHLEKKGAIRLFILDVAQGVLYWLAGKTLRWGERERERERERGGESLFRRDESGSLCLRGSALADLDEDCTGTRTPVCPAVRTFLASPLAHLLPSPFLSLLASPCQGCEVAPAASIVLLSNQQVVRLCTDCAKKVREREREREGGGEGEVVGVGGGGGVCLRGRRCPSLLQHSTLLDVLLHHC